MDTKELDALIKISEKTGVNFITNEAVTGKLFRAVLQKHRLNLTGQDFTDYTDALLSGRREDIDQCALMFGGCTSLMLFKSIEDLIDEYTDFEKALQFFRRNVNPSLVVEDSTILRHKLAAIVNSNILFKKG